MAENVTGQDPSAHLFYEVDWTEWLDRRGLLSTDIISTNFTIDPQATMTAQNRDGVISRVFIKDVPVGKRIKVSCRITAVNPDGGDDLVDDFTFIVVGRSS